jgi:hypothetical protein
MNKGISDFLEIAKPFCMGRPAACFQRPALTVKQKRRPIVESGTKQINSLTDGEDCQTGCAVEYRTRLRTAAPEIGSFSNDGGRIPAHLPVRPYIKGYTEPRPQVRSGPKCGLSRVYERATRRERTGWLGREDSNLRMAESKSAALPLGYAPIRIAPGIAHGAAEHNGPPAGDQ